MYSLIHFVGNSAHQVCAVMTGSHTSPLRVGCGHTHPVQMLTVVVSLVIFVSLAAKAQALGQILYHPVLTYTMQKTQQATGFVSIKRR